MPAGNEQGYRGWTAEDIANAVARGQSIDINAAIRGAGLNTNSTVIMDMARGMRQQQPQQDLQLLGQRGRAIAGSPADTTDPRLRALLDLAGGRGEFTSSPIGYKGTGMDLVRSVPGLLEAAGGQFALPADIRRQATKQLGPEVLKQQAPGMPPQVIDDALIRDFLIGRGRVPGRK